MVDHLAFSARLALTAARVPHADVVLGHPSALPVGDEVYGFPPAWPAAFRPDPAALAALRELCVGSAPVHRRVEHRPARARAARAAPSPRRSASTATCCSTTTPRSSLNPPIGGCPARFPRVGGARRGADADVEAWLAARAGPFVYVSFGSFLSVRADVLAPGDRGARRPRRPRRDRYRLGRSRAELPWTPRRLAGARVPAAGAAAGRRCSRGHARWQQQRHRGDDVRRAARRAAVLDRPVRRRCRARARERASPWLRTRRRRSSSAP